MTDFFKAFVSNSNLKLLTIASSRLFIERCPKLKQKIKDNWSLSEDFLGYITRCYTSGEYNNTDFNEYLYNQIFQVDLEVADAKKMPALNNFQTF